jgi:uncharacterized protein YndB with AHSA1/START domain
VISERMHDTSSLLLSRVFDGPRSLLFQLWTDPSLVSLWWGVRDATITRCELDVRPGGTWRIDMRTRRGVTYPNSGTFLEVVRNELLVYDDVPRADSPAWAGKPPAPYVHTVRFLEAGADRTSVSHQVRFASQQDCDAMIAHGMRTGLTQELDRLQAAVAESINPNTTGHAPFHR